LDFKGGFIDVVCFLRRMRLIRFLVLVLERERKRRKWSVHMTAWGSLAREVPRRNLRRASLVVGEMV